jgi:hypothetical protein
MGRGIKEFKKNIKDEEPEEEKPVARAETAPPTVASSNGAPAASGSVQALKCPSCEALNPANAKMCNQCGASLAAPVS